MNPVKAGPTTAVARASTGAIGLEAVVELVGQYLQVREQEATARRRIEAWERVQIQQIRTLADDFRTTADRIFGERATTITSLLADISVAVGSHDNEQLAILLGTLQGVIQNDPIESLADLTQLRLRLDNPDEAWTF